MQMIDRRKPIEYIHCSPTRQKAFWSRVDKTGACWLWLGSTTGHPTHPYGRTRIGCGMFVAHRVAWVITHGEDLPGHLELDHLCRETLCVNPAHLETVTHRENLHRGVRWADIAPSAEGDSHARH